MKSRKIRITESELRNIIKESVNNILSELDWKTYASASEKAFKKGSEEPTPEEKSLRYNQAGKFERAAMDKLNKQYDGVNFSNYDDRNLHPRHKRIDKNGKTLNFVKNNFQHEDDVVDIDKDKQIRGAANIARFKRGGYEYGNGKWSKKPVKEGYYAGGYTPHGEPSDEYAYIESYEYIIDSIINGNLSQAKELMSNLDENEIDELVELAKEYNCDEKLLNLIGYEYDDEF